MSSSSEDEAIVVALYHLRKKRRRRFWVHPYITNNVNRTVFICARELSCDEKKFQSFYRMSKETFRILVSLTGPAIMKMDTHYRRCVSVEERLLITLRYLATGDTFQSLSFYFARGQSTISTIVAETTAAIWNTLQPEYMSLPKKEQWKKIADRYWEVWNLPNCLGSLDGKHIKIQKIPKTGSTNFNYKGYHSIILMACSDADGIFTTIETGFAGRNSDGGIFRESRLGRWLERLEREGLDLPEDTVLPRDESRQEFPYYFVGDEAFPLKRYLMRPYPQRALNNIKRIFNYRLSRGRKTVECSFGMMSHKFQVLKTAILCTKLTTIINIIKCCCVLHNFIRIREGRMYQNPMHMEAEDNIFNRPRGTEPENLLEMPRRSPQNLRNYLANFFIINAGALPWQWQYCVYEPDN